MTFRTGTAFLQGNVFKNGEKTRLFLSGFDSTIVFSKMAPRKGKTQGKRNNVKIKSKVNTQKRTLKSSKKFRPNEKPLENLKWINQIAPESTVGKSGAVPDWLNSCSHKLKDVSNSNMTDSNLSAYEEYQPQDADAKYSASDASEECNCSVSRYPDSNKEKIPKTKTTSSANSLVTKYIKSGMNQVASFIVESAIRFGEQHGVVVPDKNTPNLYEITPPTRRFDEKFKKIRFKIPDKNGEYGPKKIKWKCPKDSKDNLRRVQTPMPSRRFRLPKSTTCESVDSLEEILPILEKLKEGGDTVTSDLDLDKLRASDTPVRPRERERERNRDRERGRERERERERERVRDKDRLRDRFRMGLCHKSASGEGENTPDEPSEMSLWKKYKRDSVELVRQRLRNANKQRDQDSTSTSPY